MSSLDRTVYVKPAYDCIGVQPCVHGSEACKPGAGSSHGRHNAELHMTVRGGDAEVALVISTGWDLPSVPEHHRLAARDHYPQGAFVQFHTGRPRYDGQTSWHKPQQGDSCEGWDACYSDTGYSMADAPAALLLEKGSDAVWEWLEDQHSQVVLEMERRSNGHS